MPQQIIGYNPVPKIGPDGNPVIDENGEPVILHKPIYKDLGSREVSTFDVQAPGLRLQGGFLHGEVIFQKKSPEPPQPITRERE